MKRLKRVLCVFLSVCLCFCTLLIFSSAKSGTANDPIVFVGGNTSPIYKADGTLLSKEVNKANVGETVKEIIFPYFINAVTRNTQADWDAYYDKFQSEISTIYDDFRLDDNGDNVNGDYVKTILPTMDYEQDGKYTESYASYLFDPRIDPFENADKLNTYIEQVKKVTNHDKIQLTTHCYGSEVVLTYLAKYGYDSISSLFIDSGMNGCSVVFSGFATGEINLDGKGIQRFLTDYLDEDIFPDGYISRSGDYGFLVEFLYQTVNMLVDYGGFDFAAKMLNKFKNNVGKNLLPRLVMCSYGTCPGYWATVEHDNLDKAIKNTFGVKDYAKKYAGLIEKIKKYDRLVGSRIREIVQTAVDKGIPVGVISKYASAVVPVFEGTHDELGDEQTLCKYTSLGATTAKVYTTFSDSYIQAQTERGLSKYISPDRQIDASTCVSPNRTWFVKGMRHDNYFSTKPIMQAFTDSNGNFTVDSDPNWPQYLIIDPTETQSQRLTTLRLLPMTSENSNDSMNWKSNEKPKKASFFKTLFAWFSSIVSLVKGLFSMLLKK